MPLTWLKRGNPAQDICNLCYPPFRKECKIASIVPDIHNNSFLWKSRSSRHVRLTTPNANVEMMRLFLPPCTPTHIMTVEHAPHKNASQNITRHAESQISKVTSDRQLFHFRWMLLLTWNYILSYWCLATNFFCGKIHFFITAQDVIKLCVKLIFHV